MHTDVRSTKQSDEAFNCPHSPQSTRLRIFFKTPGGSAITDRQAPRTVLGLARVGVASAGAVPAQRPDPCRRPLRRCRMPARGSTSAVMGLGASTLSSPPAQQARVRQSRLVGSDSLFTRQQLQGLLRVDRDVCRQ